MRAKYNIISLLASPTAADPVHDGTPLTKICSIRKGYSEAFYWPWV